MFKKYRYLWLTLGIFIALSPLGLIATGTAFGEWGVSEVKDKAGFVPAGLARMADFWKHAPISDYSIAGFNANFMQSAAGYIISALIGVVLVAGVMLLLLKIVKE